MLRVDATLNHIPARREHVIALYQSINQPLVNMPGLGTAATGAYVLGTRNDHGYYTAFVYLHQPQSRAVMVYISEPRALSAEQYRAEEVEALRFVESMGFMVDNTHFPTLRPEEQDAIMRRAPLFRPPEARAKEPVLGASLGSKSSSLSNPPLGSGGSSARPSAVDRAPAPRAAEWEAPGGEMESIFGGLSAADGEAFRRLEGAAPGAGLGLASLLGVPAGPPPLAGAPTPPALEVASTTPTLRPGSHSGGSGIPVPTLAAPSAEERAESLRRLGRRLGTIAGLRGLAVGGLVLEGGKTVPVDGGGDAAADTHADLGNQHLAQGHWREAVQAFDVVLRSDGDHREALRGMGLALMNLGRSADAERFYRRALKTDPKWSVAKNELAVVLMTQTRCEEAEALLEQVLEDILYPTPEFAEHNLARAIACQGRNDEAMSRLQKLQITRPHFCLGYLTLVQISVQAKAPEVTIEACEGFTRSCEQHEEIQKQVSPDQSAMCYLQKGLAYAELGDVESARASFERCQSNGQYGGECRRSLSRLPP